MSPPVKKIAHSRILILDFGSQYTQVIARRVRECQVYSEIVRHRSPPRRKSKRCSPRESSFPAARRASTKRTRRRLIPTIFSFGIPVLGICYGMQLMAHHLGGEVEFSARREYGAGVLHLDDQQPAAQRARRTDGYLEQPRRQADRAAERFPRHRPYRQLDLRRDRGPERAISTASNFIPKSPTRRAGKRSSRISSSASAAARWIGRWARSSTKPASECGSRWATNT